MPGAYLLDEDSGSAGVLTHSEEMAEVINGCGDWLLFSAPFECSAHCWCRGTLCCYTNSSRNDITRAKQFSNEAVSASSAAVTLS
uniref:Uncharacterized protein n=1 Tax=Globodera rostochiensis TaxID=31243 RepID=A0A914IGX2_GLORO